MGNKICIPKITEKDVHKKKSNVIIDNTNEVKKDKYVYCEKYVEVSKEPNDNVVLPDEKLQYYRELKPRILYDRKVYESYKHNIYYNNKDIIYVFTSEEDYICPICNEATMPQVCSKRAYIEGEHILKNSGLHFHYRRNNLIPCKCKNGHYVKLIYQNKCECGWPYN